MLVFFAMSEPLKIQARNALKVAIAFMPWLISMYLLYWLEYSEIWTIETAHRGKMSVAILLVGMVLSFLVRSRFARLEQK
jgi:hypothetical protein